MCPAGVGLLSFTFVGRNCVDVVWIAMRAKPTVDCGVDGRDESVAVQVTEGLLSQFGFLVDEGVAGDVNAKLVHRNRSGFLWRGSKNCRSGSPKVTAARPSANTLSESADD